MYCLRINIFNSKKFSRACAQPLLTFQKLFKKKTHKIVQPSYLW